MDFLFALLPESNFQMTDEQLILWQHNAVFECECDNFINRHYEAGRLEGLRLRNYAIDAAIQQHGLQRRRRELDSANDFGTDPSLQAPPARRPRLIAFNSDVYHESISEAIRERGLGIPRNA